MAELGLKECPHCKGEGWHLLVEHEDGDVESYLCSACNGLYGDHAAARPRVTRYAGGNAWCVYSLTPDELAALREVDWL